MNVYEIAQSYAADVIENASDRDEYYDLASEYADGSEYVIYYHQAHEFVRALPSNVQCDAEDAVADCGGADSYDDYAVKIAYFALVSLIVEACEELTEEAA